MSKKSWIKMFRSQRKRHKAPSSRSAATYTSLESRQLLAALTWSAGPSLPTPRADTIAVLAVDQAIYLAGDTATNVDVLANGAIDWTDGPAIDKPRSAPGGGPLADGRVFIFGGQTSNGQAIEESYLYDPTDADPQDGASMASPRSHSAFATDPASGRIFAFGGVDDNFAVISSCEVYDPASDLWTSIAPMPGGRADFSAAADGFGHVYTFGGRRAGYGTTDASNQVYRYDIASNTWLPMANLPVAIRDMVAVAGPNNGSIYVAGGRTATNAISGNVFAYHFDTNTWTQETNLATPVADASGTLDADGRLVVIGGRNSLSQVVNIVQVTQDLDAELTPPTIVSSPPLTATASVSYQYQLAATGNPQPQYELVSGPLGMSISAMGLVSWTPSEAQVGSQFVFVRAVNLAGFDEQTFSISVASAIPEITSNPPTTGSTGSLYSYDVDATGSPSPTFSLVAAPTGMSISLQTGLVTWTPNSSQFGSHTVTVTASNTTGIDEQTYVIAVADKVAPTAPTALAVANVTQTTVSLGWNQSTDNAGIAKYQVYEQYKYGWHNTKTGYKLIQDNIPTNSTTVTGLVSGKTYKLVVRAIDVYGNQSTNSNLVTLTTLKGPVITGPATASAVAMHAITPLHFYATGVPKPTMSLDLAPEGAVFDGATGTLTWTPTDGQVGVHQIIVSATNSEGTSSVTTTVSVNANLPVILKTFTYFGEVFSTPFAVEGDPFELQLFDNYSNSVVTWSIVSGPLGMVVDPSTGAVSWTPQAGDVGTASAVFRGTNYAGSTDLAMSFTVHPIGTDLRRPSPVSGIDVSVIDYNRAMICWTPSTDNVGVESYRVTAYYTYQSKGTKTVKYTFTAAGNQSSLEMTNLPLKSMKAYVQAFDAAGNISLVGQTVSFTMAYNSTFPSISLVNPLPNNSVAGQTHYIALTDSNPTPRTYSFVAAPPGAVIDSTTGLISWSSTYADVGKATFSVRATNEFGYRDFTFAFNVYFTGPVQSLSYTRTGAYTATVTWTPPQDISHVAGYYVYQQWTVNGHTYSYVHKVADPFATSLNDIFVVAGPVIHKVYVGAYDEFGNISVLSPKVLLM